MTGADVGVDRGSLAVASDAAAPNFCTLPFVHRLAIAYLLTPVAVWLLGWFRWWIGVPAAALLAASAWSALSGSWRLRRPSRIAVVLALAAGAWAVAPAMQSVSNDWTAYNTVLLDLTRGGWPTYPVDYLRDSPPLLRYYLGWHVVPALTGRWLGVSALDWAVPLWTWCGVALVVLLFAHGLPTLRAALLAAGVLVFFSGMDVVEMALREGVPDAVRMIRDRLDQSWIPPPRQNRSFDFMSTAMLMEHNPPTRWLLLTPQHFFPASLATLLMLGLRRHPRFLAVCGVVLVCCVFWSPLVASGLLPLAAAMLVKNRNARHVASWQNVFVALPLFALVALYLTSGAVDFERGWLWKLHDDRIRMVGDVLVLYVAEFLVLAALLWRLEPRIVGEPLFVVAVTMLLVVPWYYYGNPPLDEWGIKFDRPALMVLAYYAARTVVRSGSARDRPAYLALLAVLAAGAFTVVWDLGLRMRTRGVAPYETLDNSVQIDLPVAEARQRIAYSPREPLTALLRDRDADENGRGTLLIRSAWDVYMRNDRLVYVNPRCRRGDGQALTRFYVDVDPANPRALPADQVDAGHERRVFRLNSWMHYKEGGGCVAATQLPSYDIARIRTGQTAPDGRRLWEAEAHLTTSPPSRPGR